MTSTGWTAADLPSQKGRIFIVTGANSGIGLPTARALAAADAYVVLAVRDPVRGETAAKSIEGDCEVRRLDLADLASVRAFADAWQGDIDVLINNAGVMRTPEKRTADGFELQIGANHLGHFALSNLLLPHVTDRVVTVASGAHRGGSISLDDLNWTRRTYQRWAAYQQSKLANLLFTLELQRRLAAADSRVRALAAHPGYAATNLQFRSERGLEDRVSLPRPMRTARDQRCSQRAKISQGQAMSARTDWRSVAIPHWSGALPLPLTWRWQSGCGRSPRS